jgi:hypothetical protein
MIARPNNRATREISVSDLDRKKALEGTQSSLRYWKQPTSDWILGKREGESPTELSDLITTQGNNFSHSNIVG